MTEPGGDELDRAFRHLERLVPPFLARLLERLRAPELRWVRIPVGLLSIAASAFWFLPVVGIEFAPLGLLILAQDVPFLRKPVGLLVLWLIGGYVRLLRRWLRWRRR